VSDLVRAIRRREIDRIGSALRGGGGVISVGAEQTRDAIEVMRIALEDARSEYATDFHALASGVVDVGGCADTEEFIVSFVHAVVEVYGDVSPAVSGATRPRDREDQLARLAEYASGRLYRAARQGADLSEGEADLELFADAVDALVLRAQAQSTVLTLVAADEFVEPKGRRRSRFEGGSGLLWTLRSRLQHAGASAYLALIGGPSVIELVADDRAAFYGWEPRSSCAGCPARHLPTRCSMNCAVASRRRWARTARSKSRWISPSSAPGR
jgi:hypothetical protein